MKKQHPTGKFPFRTLTLALTAALALGGCTVTPTRLTDAERQDRASNDLKKMFVEQEPVSAPVTLPGAMARAFRYNLENRVKLMEDALARGQLDLSFYDMLPRLTAAAGYYNRSNDPGGTALNMRTGQIGTDISVAQERAYHHHNLAFSWNVLDFGISYVRAHQQADQVLIAEERQRKVMQNIVQDTSTAYWRALAAQRWGTRLDQLLMRAEAALQDSRQIEEKRLLPPLQALAYQRGLIEIVQNLKAKRYELQMAKTELAALMNLRPGTEFTLADPAVPAALPFLPDNLTALEEAALVNRAELREEDYRKRITALEAKRALISLLPGVQLDMSAQYNSNKYLYNNNWADMGMNVSFNLMRAFSYPETQKRNELMLEVDDMRRMALSMAVVAQVRIAAERYHQALAELDVSSTLDQIDQRVNEQVSGAMKSATGSELELIRAEARALLSSLQKDNAYAVMQASYARVLNSAGFDMPLEGHGDQLADFEQAIAVALKNWTLPGAVAPAGSR